MTTANIKMQRIGGLYETQFRMQRIWFAKIMAMQDAVIQDSIPISISGGLWRSPGENTKLLLTADGAPALGDVVPPHFL